MSGDTPKFCQVIEFFSLKDISKQLMSIKIEEDAIVTDIGVACTPDLIALGNQMGQVSVK